MLKPAWRLRIAMSLAGRAHARQAARADDHAAVGNGGAHGIGELERLVA